MHLLQWNVNGYYTRRESIQVLIDKVNPAIVCFQETNFKGDHCARIRRYNHFHRNRINPIHARGGSAIFVRDNIPAEEIVISLNLKVIAISASILQKITICNVYIPNSYSVTQAELDDLTRQLPTPYLIVGDINCHNRLWGLTRIDTRGKFVERWLNNTNLSLLNLESSTHFYCLSGTFSAIDLSICSPNLTDMFNWFVDDDLNDSDHYLIHINSGNSNEKSPHLDASRTWILGKAAWEEYQHHILHLCKMFPTFEVHAKPNIDAVLESFTDIIRRAADLTIPIHTGKRRKRGVPWWNAECDKTIKAAKHAFSVYKRHPTLEAKNELKN